MMSYKVRDYLVAAGIFLSIGLYKFWWVLTLPNEGLSNAGDGLGSLTVYAALRGLLQEHAYFDYFLSDQLHLKDVAQGQMPSIVPPGTLWRFLMLPVLASKIDVNNVYDLWGLVTFFLNAMCGFFLARTLKAPFWLAVVTGLLLVGMDYFSARITSHGHMTLAASFGVVLQLALVLKASAKRTRSLTLWLAVASWISFQANEYYGFYGTLNVALIALSYGLIDLVRSKQRLTTLWLLSKQLVWFSLGFLMIMALTYPTMILAKIGLSVGASSEFSRLSFGLEHLIAHSVREPLHLFYSDWMGNRIFRNPGEFSYRLGGALVLVSVLLTLLSLHAGRQKETTFLWGEHLRNLLVISFAAFTIAAVGLNPDHPLSIATPIFQKAPMFRVAARAYLIVGIDVLLIFLLSTTLYLKIFRSSALPLFLTLIVYIDTAKAPLERYAPKPLPDHRALFDAMDARGPGPVLELPVISPYDEPEKNYPYLYDWTQHHHPVVNAPLGALLKANPGLAAQFDGFALDMNLLDERKVAELGKAGIRYLQANCPGDYHALSEIKGLIPVGSDGCATLYEIKNSAKDYALMSLIGQYNQWESDSLRKISPEDCKNTSISGTLLGEGPFAPGSRLSLDVKITYQGATPWGDHGADVKLGAIWFPKGKKDHGHEGNLGETWFRIPYNLEKGGEAELTETLTVPTQPGEYELWVSPLQHLNLWCFHVGSEATWIYPVVVAPVK